MTEDGNGGAVGDQGLVRGADECGLSLWTEGS